MPEIRNCDIYPEPPLDSDESVKLELPESWLWTISSANTKHFAHGGTKTQDEVIMLSESSPVCVDGSLLRLSSTNNFPRS